MKNLNLLLLSAAFFTLSICESTKATECDEGYIVGVKTGNCIKATDSCGSGCTYTIDEQGNLNITGTGNGVIANHAFDGNLDIVTANIGAGITGTQWSVFVGATNLKSATIADTVTSIDTRHMFEGCSSLESLTMPQSWSFMGEQMIGGTKLTEFQMPDTVKSISGSNMLPSTIKNFVMPESVNSTWNPWYSNSNVTVYCTQAQIEKNVCNGTVTRYERDENGNLVVYDKDNTIKGVYGQYLDIVHDDVVDSYEKKNEETGRIERYDGRATLLGSYANNSDGSTEIYDVNGKLTGLKNATHISPAQAAALTKSSGNTVSITW